MNGTLRDRIAKALATAQEENWGIGDLDLADAVIRELGLKHSCRDCGGWGPFDD